MSRYNPDHPGKSRYCSANFFGLRSGGEVDNILTMLRHRNSGNYEEDYMVYNYD